MNYVTIHNNQIGHLPLLSGGNKPSDYTGAKVEAKAKIHGLALATLTQIHRNIEEMEKCEAVPFSKITQFIEAAHEVKKNFDNKISTLGFFARLCAWRKINKVKSVYEKIMKQGELVHRICLAIRKGTPDDVKIELNANKLDWASSDYYNPAIMAACKIGSKDKLELVMNACNDHEALTKQHLELAVESGNDDCAAYIFSKLPPKEQELLRMSYVACKA